MIHLIFTPPLPKLLRLSNDSRKLHLELPFDSKSNIQTVFQMLGETYPKFNAVLNDEGSRLLNDLIIFVDGFVLKDSSMRNVSLKDECKITFFAPYAGG